MKRRNFIRNIFGAGIAGSALAPSFEAKANLNSIVSEKTIESYGSISYFSDDELNIGCSKELENRENKNLFLLFSDLTDIKIDKDAQYLFTQSVLANKALNHTLLNTDIPRMKIGQQLPQSVVERAFFLTNFKKDSKYDLNLKFLTDYRSCLYTSLVTGILQRLNEVVCTSICQEASNEASKSIFSNVEKTYHKNIRSLKSSLLLGTRNKNNYDTVILSSKVLKRMYPIKDTGLACNYLSLYLGVKVKLYDETFWTKHSDGQIQRTRVMPENLAILANLKEKYPIEYLCTVPTEAKVDCLKGTSNITFENILYSYYTFEHNPPAVAAYAVLQGFPYIRKPQNFKVFKLESE